ncbi:MAG TPA: WG repeat-containing protein [Rhodothermales bacterium]|nr:WG repeat-containing protein [Rhodothermales bacterium]
MSNTTYRTKAGLLSAVVLALACMLSACDTINDLTGRGDDPPVVNLYPVQLDGQWGYVNREGRMVIDPQFQEAASFGEGLALVRSDWRYGYIDASGAFAIQPRYDDAGSFHDDRAAVRIDGRWGYIDRDGKIVINPQFTGANDFSEGRAFIRTARYDWEYIDPSGNVIRTANTPEFEEIDDAAFSNGLALYRSHDDMYGYLDKNGEPVIPAQYNAALPFAGGRAAIKISDRWGYIDADQKTVISPQFISAASFGEDLAPVRRDQNVWGYADRSGSVAIQPQFDQARPFVESRAAVQMNGKWGFIDRTGKAVVSPKFDEVLDFQNGLARVQVNVGESRRYGYVDASGAYVWYPTD